MKTAVNSSVSINKQELEKYPYQLHDYPNKSKWKNNEKYHEIISYKVNKQGYDKFFQDRSVFRHIYDRIQ